MKKLLLILLPIFYLFSCSSGGGISSPIMTTDSTFYDFIGTWERSAVGFDYTQYAYINEQDGAGTYIGHFEHGTGSMLVTGNSMNSIYGYDRYVIELHSDSTYDEYLYNGSVANVRNGTWSADSNHILITNSYTTNSYSIIKNIDSYELLDVVFSEEWGGEPNKIELDYATNEHLYSNPPNDYLIIDNIYERYIAIDKQ